MSQAVCEAGPGLGPLSVGRRQSTYLEAIWGRRVIGHWVVGRKGQALVP